MHKALAYQSEGRGRRSDISRSALIEGPSPFDLYACGTLYALTHYCNFEKQDDLRYFVPFRVIPTTKLNPGSSTVNSLIIFRYFHIEYFSAYATDLNET